MFEAGGQVEPRIVVLFCEHPVSLTVGRSGSRAHIRFSDAQLRHNRISVRWVSRGGPCVLHGPGQLAVYPIVPLEQVGWSAGEYLRRFQSALVGAFAHVGIRGETRPHSFGIRGRSGLLAAMGVAVRRWITCHGAFVNVNPQMQRYGFVESDPAAAADGEKTTMGCLVAERRTGVRPASVRSALVQSMSAAFESPQYHLFTGHPWLGGLHRGRSNTSVCGA
jgi:lipoate-protein ligase B